jgi:hypothetical protein
MINFKDLLSKEWFRLVGVLLIGITIGVVFYPSKRIEEKMTAKHQEEIAILKESHSKETKELSEKYTASLQENKSLKVESERKISKLSDEVKTLKAKTKVSTYKLVKPDGTIEERTFSESEVDESSRVVTSIQEEFKTKVEQIESRYAAIHTERVLAIKKQFDSKESEYKKTIDELTKSKTTTTNEKRFGIEAGITNEKNYYGHATMDVWGPTFVGVHGQVGPNNNSNNLGIGLGLRF